jgi:hypothetical protein
MYRMFIAVGLLCTGLAAADGSTVWRLYAFSKLPKEVALFYLESEVVRTPGHVQVWTKALDAAKVEADNHGKKTAALSQTAELLLKGYKPPLSTVTDLTSDQVMTVILFERVADQATVTPTVRILYDIDCAQKQFRMLSMLMNNPTGRENQPSPWQHVPPESAIETLTKLVCRPT